MKLLSKLGDLWPLIIFAGLFLVFVRQDKPDTQPEPELPVADTNPPTGPGTWLGPDGATVAASATGILQDIEPANYPEPEPEPEPTPVDQKVLSLGRGFHGILNKTNSFDRLFSQAFTDQKADALIDIHFNRYRGKHSGPLMLHSKYGSKLANALQREFIEIYEEKGWKYDKEFDLRTDNGKAVISRGNSWGKPVVISEFGYADDPNNPIGKWIQTEEGQKRIARAYLNAVRGLGYKKVILSAGHHGDRGSSGARIGKYTETEFAFDVMDQLYQIDKPRPTGNAAREYGIDDAKQIAAKAGASAEEIVFGNGSLDKPYEAPYVPPAKAPGYVAAKPSGNNWELVEPKAPVTSDKPKAGLFARWKKSNTSPSKKRSSTSGGNRGR